MNVIMSPEPVDLTPKFDALKADLLADIASKHTAVISNTDSENAAISAKLDSLTTVNGQISTEVQAINSHTDTKVSSVIAEINQNDSKLQSLSSQLQTAKDEIDNRVWAENNQTESRLNVVSNEIKALVNAKSAIKSIQRGTTIGDASVTIAAVNTQKTVVRLLSSVAGTTGSYSYIDEVRLHLANSTTLVVDGTLSFGSEVNMTISWEVIEYV